MTEMVLPQFGMGMADGTITVWHKAEGDRLEAGEPLCDVEAAKTTVEVAAPRSGILQRIIVPAGTNVPVNTVIALIGETALTDDHDHAKVKDVAPLAESEPVAVAANEVVRPVLRAVAQPPVQRSTRRTGQAPQIEPRARRAAQVHGVDLSVVLGTGPGGRIIESDVLDAARSPVAPLAVSAPAADNAAISATKTPAPVGTGMWQLHMQCDARPLTALLKQLATYNETAVPFEAALLRAAALAVAQGPLAKGGIGLRSDAGKVRVIDGLAGLSLSAIAKRLDAAIPDTGPSPAVMIEWHREEWLQKVTSFDPSAPVCLSFGPVTTADGNGAEQWEIVLTAMGAGTLLTEAKRLLHSLDELLSQPLAILA